MDEFCWFVLLLLSSASRFVYLFEEWGIGSFEERVFYFFIFFWRWGGGRREGWISRFERGTKRGGGLK